MQEIFKSNNIVEISLNKYILKLNNIDYFVMDEQMSTNEGNISAIPVRILVKKNLVNNAKLLIENEKKKL